MLKKDDNTNKRLIRYDYLIITVVILIIAIVAYPIYKDHVIYTKRTEAKFNLLNLVGAMERHYSKYNSYESATIGTNPTTDIINNEMTVGNWYKLEIASQTDHDYTLRAIPQNQQAIDDTKCGILTISKFGEKRISGQGPISKCWD
ncbi:MAG: hypothetical protein HRT87_04220 [Legionellales bacterium]|nr:hypothetical protein [Legionellales bacterium]